jgi:hypothetical protein
MLVVVLLRIRMSPPAFHMPHERLRHPVQDIFALVVRPFLPRVLSDRSLPVPTLRTGMIPPASCKFGHMKVSEFKSCVFGDFLPGLYELYPSVWCRNAKCRGCNPRSAISTAVIHVNYLHVGT